MENYATIPQMIQYVVNTYSNYSALNFKNKGSWETISTEKFSETIRRLALGLHSLGIKEGEGIGLIANPSPQWVMIDIAIMVNRAISVPMFANISSTHFQFQSKDSNVKYLFVDDEELLADAIKPLLHSFTKIISYHPKRSAKNAISFEELLTLGDQLSAKQPNLYSLMRQAVRPKDIATVIYTSGTTGMPKGVEITHANLISQIRATTQLFPLHSAKDKALTCLPLAHVFERMVIYFYISTGTPIFFADDIKKVGELLRQVQPSVITLVPRLLEKVYAKMHARIEEQSTIKKKLMSSAFERAISKEPGAHNLLDKIYDKLIYSKLREALGGNLQMVISGGAALSVSMENFFKNIGLNLYQGYGLTETSPVLAANYPGNTRYRSVGKIWPGVEIKISDQQEILAKGPNIMKGYHNDPQTTRETIDPQGWLHTGDLGFVDQDGYLFINGRKKEIFKTSNGKYVSPIPIEQMLCVSELIDMAAIMGENKNFVSCLLFPDFENLGAIKKNRGYSDMSKGDFLNSSEVTQEIAALVERVNSQLNEWEKIRKFKFIKQSIGIETGELTPTMKIRRQVIEQEFSEIINNFYRDQDQEGE
ncbi:AMP-dependent synthetase and ligase [Psychromonas ingrahamii 37]|uniref:AMP-dependent synthetase and ligase n=1 Tax=Psychromonas ingrahamii (strain DSM 17664 / CCUG 51855 / 37) TaxID=357804 RepID=A1SXW0_PSYIN|nr:long-chain fatty acid--CoA ligase [Psychromonas ingrahamii]ABM04325.1 AMP-dependent synthetase and ligase [Psychromonas ingrahamii 37]